jgi:hypothetical protein
VALRRTARRFPTRLQPGPEGLEARVLNSLPGLHLPAAEVQQFIPLLYPPGTPQPTPQEVARESFVARSAGTYTIGPGQFANQALTIHGGGKPGNSNMSSRTRFQFVLYEPKDPTQPVTGAIFYVPADFLQSGSSILLDLSGPTGTGVNGLPTHLNWIHDPDSGIIFTGAGTLPIFNGTAPIPGTDKTTPSTIVDFNLGAGVSTFKFVPDRHPLPGTLGSGKVYLITQGLLNVGPNSPINHNYD